MARGDGKARKGFTRGKSAQKMATGGLAASSREGGFAGAGASRLESPGQRSSVSPGGGNVSAGRSPGGNVGGAGREGGGGTGMQRDITRGSVPTQASAAKSGMLDFAVRPTPSAKPVELSPEDVARFAAHYHSNRVGIRNDALGTPTGFRGTLSEQGSLPVRAPSPARAPSNVSASRTTPEDPMQAFNRATTQIRAAAVSPTGFRGTMGSQPMGMFPAQAPKARPEDVFGGFNYTPSVRQPSAAPRMMSSAQDYASIVPGSVSFTQPEQFQPFAQSKRGQELLKKSQSVMTYEEAQKLKEEMPPGTKYSWSPMESGSGYTSYPVKVDTGLLGVRSGYTNIPNKAGSMVPGDIKVGTWNPAAPQAQPRATPNYGIQTSRAEPTAAPKSITDQLGGGEPTYTPNKDYSRLEGLTGPTEPPVYRPPTPPVKKPPAVVTAAPRGNLPKIKEGQVIVKDGRRYQMRDGKLYNFNIGQPQKREKSRELPLKDGGRARSDGIAYRGKTKGRYI